MPPCGIAIHIVRNTADATHRCTHTHTHTRTDARTDARTDRHTRSLLPPTHPHPSSTTPLLLLLLLWLLLLLLPCSRDCSSCCYCCVLVLVEPSEGGWCGGWQWECGSNSIEEEALCGARWHGGYATWQRAGAHT